MKLASYLADGRAAFGVVTDDGVITMNERLSTRCREPKEALAAGFIPQMAELAAKAEPDHKLADITFLPVIPDPELIACAGINYRSHASETGREHPQAAEHVHPARQHAGRPRRRDDPPERLDQFRFRGRACGRDRPRRPPYRGGARARSCRRLHLLRRRQRARLPEILGHLRQEFPRHRAARPLDRHHRRNPRPDPPHADDPPQRHRDAALRHRSPDLLDPADHRLLLRLHPAVAGRRDRHRHARRRRPPPHAAALDEGRRRAGGGDHRHRHLAQPDRGRAGRKRFSRPKDET